MINLAWGGFANGSVPDSALSAIDGQGHKLEHVAAARFLAMQAALLRDLGRTISVAPGSDSANRTLSQQEVDYNLYLRGGNVAAVPTSRGGQGSNHGWARAVDITGYEGNTRWTSPNTGRTYYVDLPVWLWLQAHAAEYGFHWATGDASGEGWHWESYNPPSATAIAAESASLITDVPKEDDMPMFYLAANPTQPPAKFVKPSDVFIQEGSGPLRLLTADEWGARQVIQKPTAAQWDVPSIMKLISRVGVYGTHPGNSLDYSSILYT